jgi:hypothetical protein
MINNSSDINFRYILGLVLLSLLDSDNSKLRSISELLFLNNRTSFLNLINFYQGKEIRIPDKESLNKLFNAIKLYYHKRTGNVKYLKDIDYDKDKEFYDFLVNIKFDQWINNTINYESEKVLNDCVSERLNSMIKNSDKDKIWIPTKYQNIDCFEFELMLDNLLKKN